MIYTTITEFKQHQLQNQRIIAIDYGRKKTGIALSDRSLSLSTPHSIIKTASKIHFITQLKIILAENITWGIILGFPLQMDGTEGKACEKIREVAKDIQVGTNLPILLVDERETSIRAHEILKTMNLKRKKRDSLDDKIAANILLANILDII